MFDIQDDTTEDIGVADLIMATRLTRDLKKAATKLSCEYQRNRVNQLRSVYHCYCVLERAITCQ